MIAFLDGSFELDYNSFIYDTVIENYTEGIDEPSHNNKVPCLQAKQRSSEAVIVNTTGSTTNYSIHNSNSNSNANSNMHPNPVATTYSYSSNKIVIDNIILGEEKRTTVKIKNIPPHYTYDMIHREIKARFEGKFNYLSFEKVNMTI